MSRIVFEGNYKIFWLDSVSSKSAPTVAEITGGTDVTDFVPKDGLRYGPGFDKVDAGNIAAAFDPQFQGSWRMDGGLTIQRDDTTDTAFELWSSHGKLGVLVALPQATDSSPASGDKAFVMPADASIAVPNNTAKNALQTAEVDMAFRDVPDFQATVAA